MKRIRKAVIPAAGYGTGFLPATKAQPKELLPIVDKPVIQFIVEEALASGIEEVLIITGRHKRNIENHFDSNIELEDHLTSQAKDDLLDLVQATTQSNLFYIRQAYPKGLADAIYQARAFVGQEPFLVMLGDNIFQCPGPTASQQVMANYDRYQRPCVGSMPATQSQTLQKHGILDLGPALDLEAGVYPIESLVEKPSPQQAPSRQTIVGRYVLPPEIFPIIEDLKPGVDGELQLTDALDILNRTQPLLAQRIQGRRYDVGDKLGYLMMVVQYGLSHPEIQGDLASYLKGLASRLEDPSLDSGGSHSERGWV